MSNKTKKSKKKIGRDLSKDPKIVSTMKAYFPSLNAKPNRAPQAVQQNNP